MSVMVKAMNTIWDGLKRVTWNNAEKFWGFLLKHQKVTYFILATVLILSILNQTIQ